MAIIKESVSTLTSDGRLCWAAHHQPISDHHHDSYPFDFFHVRFTSSFLFYFFLFFLWVFPWLWRDVNAETRGRRIASVLRLVAVRVARTKMMAWPPNSAARGLSLSLSLSLFFLYKIWFWFWFWFCVDRDAKALQEKTAKKAAGAGGSGSNASSGGGGNSSNKK